MRVVIRVQNIIAEYRDCSASNNENLALHHLLIAEPLLYPIVSQINSKEAY